MDRSVRKDLLDYGGAVLAVAGAVVVRWLLGRSPGDGAAFAMLCGAVALAVWSGGYRPALVCLTLGFLVFTTLFLDLQGIAILEDARRLLVLVLYLVPCVIIIILGEAARIARRRLEDAQALERREYEERAHERERLVEQLGQSEEKYRRMVETANEGIWTLDADARITFVNPRMAELLGYTVEAMVGHTVWEFTFQEDLPRAHELVERRRAGISEHADVRFRHRDGRSVWTLMAARPTMDAQGHFQGALDLFTDITERRQAVERLREQSDRLRAEDRRKDEFLATLAHELRNPLAPIRTALEILRLPRVDAASAERARVMMERQVQHLIRLVDDLLDVSRVMRGKITLHRERLELASAVARAVEIAQSLLEAQCHELAVRLPDESLPLDADPTRLAQVIGNLLTNAAKYTERGGRITLTAERETPARTSAGGAFAVLRVRDTGIGIEPEMLPRIFDLFVQADHATTRAQGGLGIGLTLVRNLVEMHQGTVEAHSAGLGKGSEFVVRLPLASPQAEEAAPRKVKQEHKARAAAGHRVLVVDDNVDAADSLAMLLRLQGHQVVVAHDGPTALRLTAQNHPELVFLDLGMPGMDGYEVARRLRRQGERNGLVLVALTGWGAPEDRRQTAEAGFDHHLVKPVEPRALDALLAGLPPQAHEPGRPGGAREGAALSPDP